MMRRILCSFLSLVSISPAVSQAASLIGTENIYFGHLHNHTSFSDGSDTPEQAYNTARGNGLDFFGLSDHSDLLTATEFETMRSAADNANVSGVFSAFWGFEWSHNSYGHITVVNSGTFTTTSATSTFSGFMAWLDAYASIAFFNHPGRQDGSTSQPEFEHFTGAYSSKIVGMELWNKTSGFGTYYYNGGYTSDSEDRSGYYDEALLSGWSIGASGSEDHHGTTWGSGSYRLAVLSGSNTRETILDALSRRRFYSTLDRNLELSFQVDGSEMGSSVPGGWNRCVVKAADRDGESFSKVEIIQNGYIVHTENVSGTLPVVTYDLFTQQGDTIYCKVTQSDGDEAISSPVFVTSNGPDGPPRADLAVPLDNGSADLDPDSDSVTVNTPQPSFQIQLVDFEGIDDNTVVPGTVSMVSTASGVDYTFTYDAQLDIITLAPGAGDVFGDGTYTITLGGISDHASPANTMAATTLTVRIDTSIVLPETLSFTTAVDTMISGAARWTSYSGASIITVDADDSGSGSPSQVLLRFNNLVGTAGDQIPAYATIESATLRLWSLDTGNGGTLYPMLQDWSDAATWDSLLGGDGVQTNDAEASSLSDDGISSNSSGFVELDVTGSVQNWVDGVFSNYGWVILPNGADGWDIASAEYGMADYRPKLTVTFTPGSTTGNRAPVADAGTDQTVNDDDGDGYEMVILSASASRDLDGYVSTYAWTEEQTVLGSDQIISYLFPVGTHTVTLTVSDDKGAVDTDTVVIAVTETMTLEGYAVGETLVEGMRVAGDYRATWSAGDGVVEVIQEAISGNNKNIVRSSLEHIWQFDVTGGDTVTMHLAATAQLETGSPDQFVFAYSTDGVSYTNIVTVAGAVEGDYSLPNAISGVLYIRVSDTNSDKLDSTVDSVSVDCINIRSTGTGVPSSDSEPPSAPTDLTAVSSNSSVQLSWNTNSESDLAGYYVYRSTSSGGYTIACSGLVVGTSFVDSGLAAGTYYYVVRAVDLSDNLSDFSNEVSVTVAEIPAEKFVSVSSVTVTLNEGKKYSAEATVAVTPALAGAVVTGDWYFKGVIMRQNTVTGKTTNDGVAIFTTPFETPAKSGDLFTFVVTNVAASGYTYSPGANDAAEASVP